MKFKLGDKVILKESSEYCDQYKLWDNPTGEIIKVRGDGGGSGGTYTVRSGSYENAYRDKDLELIKDMKVIDIENFKIMCPSDYSDNKEWQEFIDWMNIKANGKTQFGGNSAGSYYGFCQGYQSSQITDIGINEINLEQWKKFIYKPIEPTKVIEYKKGDKVKILNDKDGHGLTVGNIYTAKEITSKGILFKGGRSVRFENLELVSRHIYPITESEPIPITTHPLTTKLTKKIETMDLLKDLQEGIKKLEAERDGAVTNLNGLASTLTKLEADNTFQKGVIDDLEETRQKLTKELKELRATGLTKDKFDELEKKLKENQDRIDKLFAKEPKKKKVAGRSKAWNNVIIEEVLYKKLQLSYAKKMPMLLKGPSGTGKSTMVRALANEHGRELVEFNFNGDTTVEHLLGHKILVNGNMIWEDGPLTDAVRKGKVFIGHELNSSNTEIQFIFNGLLELDSSGNLGKLAVQGNNGEVITPDDGFRFYGTYNPGYLGTKTFGTSLMSRFIGAEVKPLSPKDEASFLQNIYPKHIAEINLLVDLESQLRADKNFNYDISTRDIIQTLMFIEGGFSIEEAVEATIANSCQIDLEIDTLNKKLDNLISNTKK